MTSKAQAIASSPARGKLERLLTDCSELETLVASIKETFDTLNPAEEDALTAEHLMNFAICIESAERGLIEIAHRIDDSATDILRRRQAIAMVH